MATAERLEDSDLTAEDAVDELRLELGLFMTTPPDRVVEVIKEKLDDLRFELETNYGDEDDFDCL